MKTHPCAVCHRQISHLTRGWREWECSHASCPERPKAWSDFSPYDFEPQQEEEPQPTIERLFDKP